VLNAEGYDYFDDTLTAGVHLVIHEPQDPPRLIGYDAANIVLTAGTQNFISVRVRFWLLSFIHLYTYLLTYLFTYLFIYAIYIIYFAYKVFSERDLTIFCRQCSSIFNH